MNANPISDLKRLGVRTGDILLVHSSYRATGKVCGSPNGLIEALLEAVQPGGTLLMPNLNIPGEFTTDNPPRWDVKAGFIADKLGIVAQVFKERYATDFSWHPTHSMAGCGPRACEILAGHERIGLPCGPGTPWQRFATMGGKILLLGVTNEQNTMLHSAEESIPDPYRLTSEIIMGTVIVDGDEVPAPSRLHRWAFPTRFDVLNDELESLGIMNRGMVGHAQSFLLKAGDCLDLALKRLRADRQYLLRDRLD